MVPVPGNRMRDRCGRNEKNGRRRVRHVVVSLGVE